MQLILPSTSIIIFIYLTLSDEFGGNKSKKNIINIEIKIDRFYPDYADLSQ
jgi:hypothetical protein